MDKCIILSSVFSNSDQCGNQMEVRAVEGAGVYAKSRRINRPGRSVFGSETNGILRIIRWSLYNLDDVTFWNISIIPPWSILKIRIYHKKSNFYRFSKMTLDKEW
jgi:hypothetical protein